MFSLYFTKVVQKCQTRTQFKYGAKCLISKFYRRINRQLETILMEMILHRSFAANDYFILFQFPDSLINKSKYACIALFDSKSIWRLNLQQNTDKKRFILLSNLIPYLYHEQRRSFIPKKRLFFFSFISH